jgi:hypothetical protein
MGDAIGIGIITLAVSFIMGWFIALVVSNINYWLDQKAEAKQTTLLKMPNGKWVTLPPGIKYIPMPTEKEEN